MQEYINAIAFFIIGCCSLVAVQATLRYLHGQYEVWQADRKAAYEMEMDYFSKLVAQRTADLLEARSKKDVDAQKFPG